MWPSIRLLGLVVFLLFGYEAYLVAGGATRVASAAAGLQAGLAPDDDDVSDAGDRDQGDDDALDDDDDDDLDDRDDRDDRDDGRVPAGGAAADKAEKKPSGWSAGEVPVSIATLRTKASQLHHTLIAFDLGVGAFKRTQVLSAGSAEQSWSVKTTAELIISAAFYPFALLSDGALRDFGIGVRYTHGLGGEIEADGAQLGSAVAGECLVDLRWRKIWDATVWSPRIGLSLGWGTRSFAGADDPRGERVPAMNYRFLRLRGAGQLALGTPLVALDAAFELRPLLSVGQDAVDAWGQRDSGIALAAELGLGGQHRSGFYYRVSLLIEQYRSGFTGLDPSVAPLRPHTLDQAEPSVSSDASMAVAFSLGFAL